MKRSSNMRRRYASAMLTGMLTAALLSSSCASRRCNLTAVRSDSLSASVTERTVYEPVPKRTAGLKVSAAQWTQLRNLPEGFGLAVRTDGMNLSLTADGEGGVSVTAEADSIGREVTYRREETANRTPWRNPRRGNGETGTVPLVVHTAGTAHRGGGYRAHQTQLTT